ncbi:uncharacterized protein BJ212DRAFT_1485953 [Suillus subaureus]|uniref:Uncharacterized protein n=1 Tax=Suillus subaureus TaxID=48587 RepID=A0A9P7J778_9AGAM|nr:uncharacterized protein BJ212DRAFT_1485953 [Suillus subaureus]KAG1806200.1 hypothetical protein BJ212DRAFT_1485953 [Suillus subaureus]
MSINMMPDTSMPWLYLKSKMHKDKATDTADKQGIVTHAMEDMAIDDDDVPSDGSVDQSSHNDVKHKRTSSQPLPPKKDGGCGPLKHLKAVVKSISSSIPTIQSLIVLVQMTPEPEGLATTTHNIGDASGVDDDIDAVGDIDDEQLFSSLSADPLVIIHSCAVMESSITTENAHDWLENMLSLPG